MERISVLISAWNKHDITAAHVRECLNSTRLPYEIIVVNDGGTSDLKDKLKETLGLRYGIDHTPVGGEITLFRPKLIYAEILPPKIAWNYTGARNLGIWLSTGDYISLEDNDHIPTRTYYEECVKAFAEYPEVSRLRTHKRRVVSEEDVLTKPMEEWKQISSRPCHQDVAFNKREVFLQLKGYDERFAGEYGWCSTDLNRRLSKAGIVCGNAGYQWVVFSEKTRGLSYRNFRLARTQKETQSPSGIINFQYKYEIL